MPRDAIDEAIGYDSDGQPEMKRTAENDPATSRSAFAKLLGYSPQSNLDYQLLMGLFDKKDQVLH